MNINLVIIIWYVPLFYPILAQVNPGSFLDEEEISQFASMQYPDTKQVNYSYDFIIVGAGTAGCVVANRLSENPNWSILLIEAGDYETLKLDIPAFAPRVPKEYSWNYYTKSSFNNNYGLGAPNQSLYLHQGRVVGGTSSINGLDYSRGHPENYNRWRNVYLNENWSWKDVEKYFLKLENYQADDTSDGSLFGTNGPLDIESSSYCSNLSAAILNAAQENGYNLTCNSISNIGYGRKHSTKKFGLRVSSNRAYLMPIRNIRPNLHLKIKSLTTKIVTSPRLLNYINATGVEFINESKKYRVFARKEVIICAGAINTPKLLMLSGIGHKKHLEENKITSIQDLPVGDNLIDHAGVSGPVKFSTNYTIFPTDELKLYSFNKSGPLSVPNGIEVGGYTTPLVNGIPQIEHVIGADPISSLNGFYFVVGLMTPKSRGTVRLRDKNPYSAPVIDPNLLSYSEEVEMLLKGITDFINITKEPALQALNTQLVQVQDPNCKNFIFLSSEYFRCIIRTNTISYAHVCGTCKMGPKNDSSTVVDSDLRVHGFLNLRVIDASVMPEVVSGHTAAATYMIAEKGSDIIKNFWKIEY